MSTMKDIARITGVGLGTVSRVLNNTGPVSDSTRAKVEAAIRELHYRPNRIARKLVSGRSGKGFYGVLMPLFIHPFYFYVLRGVHRFMEEMDTNLILFNRGLHPEEAISRLLEEDILGLMVMSHGLSREEEELMKSEKLDYCYLDYHRGNHPSVWVDNRAGGRLAAEHLVAQGCQSISFLGDLGNSQQQIERYEGFADTLRELGSGVKIRKLVPRQEFSAAGVEEIFASEPDTDGLFFFSDSHALEALPVLAGKKRSVRVVGYDDLDFTRFLGLTTVHQPMEELGYAGARMLHRLVHEPEDNPETELILQPSLSIRGPLALEHFIQGAGK